MFSWGHGNFGQLGLGGIEETNIGIPSPVIFEGAIRAIAVGSEHSLILLDDGKAYSCGSNDYGQLGHSEMQTRYASIESLGGYDLKNIACGAQHSLALDEWGKVFAWGSDSRGQIGHEDGNKNLPKTIRSLGHQTIVQISAGLHHSLALANDGKIYAWGDNSCGQLGLGKEAGDNVSKPQVIESLIGVTPLIIAAGGEHSMMVTLSGTVYAWGKNAYGQLGLGDTNNNFYPRQIRMLRSLGVKYIACGRDHSVILTVDGGVFSFGMGRFGQLGHGSFSNESWPRQVMELMGTEVTQVTCGDRHTLAFIPSRGKLYSFGLGGSGQLGIESLSNVNTPQVIYGPWVQPSGQPRRITRQHSSSGSNYSEEAPLAIYTIAAGGNSSFAAVRSPSQMGQILDFRTFYASQSILRLTPSLMAQLMSISDEEMVDQDLMQSLETIFQSPSCINASFLLTDHSNCSSKKHGVDLDAWSTEVFIPLSICPRESIKSLVHDSISNKLVPLLTSSPPDVEVLRIYLILPLYKTFRDNSVLFRELHFIFALRIVSLDKNPGRVLEKWISALPQPYFSNFVLIFKQALVESFNFEENKNMQTGSISKISTTFLILLRILNRINSEQQLCIINEEDFYVSEMSEHFDLQSSYVYWLLNKHQTSSTANHVCNFPFTFDATAKTTLLEVDQGFQMHSAQQRATFQYWFNAGFGDPESFSFLNLEVDRDNLVQTTLSIVHQLSPGDLKKPLRIKFKDEEAEDAGGVKKEFFLLLIREITDPKYGMFKVYEEESVIWFSSSCFEDSSMFQLIGVLCGLAIYNFTIINIPFPLPLYKKLLGVKVGSIEDYACLSPATAEGLKRMLDFNSPEDMEALALNFTLTEDVFGESRVVELKAGGEDIEVTLENKQEYVDLYIDHVLNKSVLSQYNAFHEGFHKVCGGRVLDLFHAKELMALVVGNENYDWDELEKNALYKNGYTRESETIQDFWYVFHGLSLDDKKKFLLFLTGTDRIPILGMKAVSLIIQRTNETEYLPVAHTCFNILDLPDYQSRETLSRKLLISIQCTQGFGLA